MDLTREIRSHLPPPGLSTFAGATSAMPKPHIVPQPQPKPAPAAAAPSIPPGYMRQPVTTSASYSPRMATAAPTTPFR